MRVRRRDAKLRRCTMFMPPPAIMRATRYTRR
jgi:hypothetical protein